jgi:hypothetical protein
MLAACPPQIRGPVRIASRPHCKHLPEIIPGFETRSSPNLLVTTLATLRSVSLVPSARLERRWLFPVCGNRVARALQHGKDPSPPRLWRDKRGGAGAVSVAPTSVHALYPTLIDMVIIYHKRLMVRMKSDEGDE